MTKLQVSCIPLVRAAFSEPIRSKLHEIGVSPRRFEQVGIPLYAEESPYTFIPERPWWLLLDRLADREGIPDLGLLVGDPIPFSEIRSMSAQLRGAHTLRELVLKFIEAAHYQSSNARFRLVEGQAGAVFCNVSPSLVDEEGNGLQILLFQLRGMMQIAQQVLGASWRPRRLYLPCPPSQHLSASPILGAHHMLFDQPFAAFDLSLHELDTPVPLSAGSTRVDRLTDGLAQLNLPPAEFLASLRELITFHLCEEVPTLERVAAICDMSPRTLQRRLAELRLSFVALLDEARRNRGLHLVCHSDMSLADIAHVLGYSDYQKFSRAFKRWNGKTPRQYRQE